jgi:S1-C subfamily serine protease
MRRFAIGCLAAALIVGLAVGAWADDKKAKQKPKDAPTLDDRTGTLTEVVGGEKKERKLELKYSLKVDGYFDDDGFNIEGLDRDGPAAKLMDDAGNQTAILEKGDIVVEIDGKKVKTPKEYMEALNKAADPMKIKLKIRDVNTGNDQVFYAAAVKR